MGNFFTHGLVWAITGIIVAVLLIVVGIGLSKAVLHGVEESGIENKVETRREKFELKADKPGVHDTSFMAKKLKEDLKE
jgi:hypothetical protein